MLSLSSLRLPILLLLFPLIFLKVTDGQTNFKTAEDFVATRYINQNVVRFPRGILLDEAGDILVISRKPLSQITAVYETSPNVVETTVIVNDQILGLNHGIAYNGGYLYASSDTTVYRWPYTPGQRSAIVGVQSNPEIVIKNMPSGGHETRSLVFDRVNSLYISVGSANNIDSDSSRARIRRFNLGQGIPPGGFEFKSGEVTTPNSVFFFALN